MSKEFPRSEITYPGFGEDENGSSRTGSSQAAVVHLNEQDSVASQSETESHPTTASPLPNATPSQKVRTDASLDVLSLGTICAITQRAEVLRPGIGNRISFDDLKAVILAFQAEMSYPQSPMVDLGHDSRPGSVTPLHVEAAGTGAARSGTGPRPKKVVPQVQSGPSASSMKKQGKIAPKAVSKGQGQSTSSKQKAQVSAPKPKGKAESSGKAATSGASTDADALRKKIISKIWRSLRTKVGNSTLQKQLAVTEDMVRTFVHEQKIDDLKSWESRVDGQLALHSGTPLTYLEISGFFDIPQIANKWANDLEIQDYRSQFEARRILRVTRTGLKPKILNKIVVTQAEVAQSCRGDILGTIARLPRNEVQTILHAPGIPAGAWPPAEMYLTDGPKRVGGAWMQLDLYFSEEKIKSMNIPIPHPSFNGRTRFRLFVALMVQGGDLGRLTFALNSAGIPTDGKDQYKIPVVDFGGRKSDDSEVVPEDGNPDSFPE